MWKVQIMNFIEVVAVDLLNYMLTVCFMKRNARNRHWTTFKKKNLITLISHSSQKTIIKFYSKDT